MTWRESSTALKNGDFRKLFEAFSVGAGDLMAPGAAPGVAHLVGTPTSAPRAVEAVDPLERRLAALEREIERRRRA
ncbi:MAG TPA: hypothetical protein VLT61_04430 [Anaeromyxobacteraceae bacterium]|nr:hypothetical protein [Anaeromyxobacteraceae bacterium]